MSWASRRPDLRAACRSNEDQGFLAASGIPPGRESIRGQAHPFTSASRAVLCQFSRERPDAVEHARGEPPGVRVLPAGMI